MADQNNKCYIAIDLKSFYASVECVERGLDPLDANLVVADASRTDKTICLAVTPALKQRGIPGRPRLFEVVQAVRQINAERRRALRTGKFRGRSCSDSELRSDPSLELDYIVAPPQMAKYMEVSTEIYQIYLKYVSPEDIHVYSVDEVFIDVTHYLSLYRTTPRGLAVRMIHDVLRATGITAAAGIGSNMYLCKIAMDIEAKKSPADSDGVRIAELDEESYRERLWEHRPLTDFWRIGNGYAKKLEAHGLYTMGDIARCSVGGEHDAYNEALLYRLFGINAELLIDHAWGWEPCEIADVKSYVPDAHSLSLGQVLQSPYSNKNGRLIVREMTDLLVLDLVDKGLTTDQMTLTVEYDVENLADPRRRAAYRGKISTDHFGRPVPQHAHGTANLDRRTSSTRRITEAVLELYDRITDKNLTVRKIYVVACRVQAAGADTAYKSEICEQMNIFTDYAAEEFRRRAEDAADEKELKIQKTILQVRKKHGKNAVLRGMNFEEGATTIERNRQIGGHRA
ncbi:MAG: DNA methylase [Clostridia bacterium]|nr:DNA methylase [Clostridia bacterium]